MGKLKKRVLYYSIAFYHLFSTFYYLYMSVLAVLLANNAFYYLNFKYINVFFTVAIYYKIYVLIGTKRTQNSLPGPVSKVWR